MRTAAGRTTRTTPATRSRCSALEVRLDRGDAVGRDAPRVLDADARVEVPEDALLARLGDEAPGDHGAAELILHRTAATGAGALGVVVEEATVGGVAERGVPGGAEDEAVPGLVDRARGHPDHLAVAHRRGAAAQPLAQAGIDQLARLPGAGAPDRLGKLQRRDRAIRGAQVDDVTAKSHRATLAA